MKKIILASGSEGRKELFSQIFGENFRIEPSGVPEEDLLHLPPKEMVCSLADRKAKYVAEKYPDYIICAFDTTVECNGKILGKPSSKKESEQMLSYLSEKIQTIWTGYTIILGDQLFSGVDSASLILNLTPIEIKNYIQTHDTTKFAGAYAVQKQDTHITLIKGSIDTIIGAPMKPIINIINTLDPNIFTNKT